MDRKTSSRDLRARRLAQAALISLLCACKRDRVEAVPDDARAIPRAPTDPLEGRWISETTKRELEAKLVNDQIEFRVVDANQWDGAYSNGEVRFALRRNNNTLEVVDLYRPAVPTGSAYDPDGQRACLFRVTGLPDGSPLRASVAADGALNVDFAAVTMQLIWAEDATRTVGSCRDPAITGRITSTLHRTVVP